MRARTTGIWPVQSRPRGAYWRDHARIVRDTSGYVMRRFAATLWVWSMIGIAMALPAALYLLEANLGRAAGQWHEAPGFSVYFKPGVAMAEPLALFERLEDTPGIDRVWITTPEEALAEFGELTDVGDVLELLDENPLPASVRATVDATVSPSRLSALAAGAAGENGVEDVVVERQWLERLAAVREIVTRLYWSFAVVLGLGAVLISAAAVRLAIEARLAEIRVLALVGASRGYLRRPFLYLGAVYGMGGALIAAAAISALTFLLEEPLDHLFGSYGWDLELIGSDPMFYLTLLGSGAVLGVFGSVVASSRRLGRLNAPPA